MSIALAPKPAYSEAPADPEKRAEVEREWKQETTEENRRHLVQTVSRPAEATQTDFARLLNDVLTALEGHPGPAYALWQELGKSLGLAQGEVVLVQEFGGSVSSAGDDVIAVRFLVNGQLEERQFFRTDLKAHPLIEGMGVRVRCELVVPGGTASAPGKDDYRDWQRQFNAKAVVGKKFEGL